MTQIKNIVKMITPVNTFSGKLTKEEYAALSDKQKEVYKSELFSAVLIKNSKYPVSLGVNIDCKIGSMKVKLKKQVFFKKPHHNPISASEAARITKEVDQIPLKW